MYRARRSGRRSTRVGHLIRRAAYHSRFGPDCPKLRPLECSQNGGCFLVSAIELDLGRRRRTNLVDSIAATIVANRERLRWRLLDSGERGACQKFYCYTTRGNWVE